MVTKTKVRGIFTEVFEVLRWSWKKTDFNSNKDSFDGGVFAVLFGLILPWGLVSVIAFGVPGPIPPERPVIALMVFVIGKVLLKLAYYTYNYYQNMPEDEEKSKKAANYMHLIDGDTVEVVDDDWENPFERKKKKNS